MKTRLNRYRTVIVTGICLLIFLLVIMTYDLFVQLRTLSSAADDNTQWSISQLDIEFANLQVALVTPPVDGVYDDRQIKLRLDIALSRLGILKSGRSKALFAESADAKKLIASVSEFADKAIVIADQPGSLTQKRVSDLKSLTEKVRPDVRKIALLVVDIDAVRSDSQRAAFSRQLRRTGGTTISLVILMGLLMVLLDRLLIRAARRDAELSTSSALLKSTIGASLDAIVTENEKGEIIEFNAAAEHVFGWTRDEIMGKTMEETFIPHHMREAHHSGMHRYLQTGVPRVVGGGRIELTALRRTGEEFPVALNITSVTDDVGTKFIAYIQDISERKISEQKLIDARDRAEQTDRAKSQFLTVMSHEMRTPLNGIMGVLDLLRTTGLNEKQDRYACIATASSEILLGHTNEALDITRIETNSFHLTPQDFDLQDLMTSLVDVLEPLAQEKKLSMSLQIEDAMRADFYGDSSRIRQIVTNLVGNAIKFTRTGGISIEVNGIHGAEETSLRISVADTGAGIPSEYHEQIFEDFVALSYSEGRQSRGDGLGLSISRRIARTMGGDISVTSTVDKGSTFTLTVPLKRQKRRQPATRHNRSLAMNLDQAALRILVVEDNDINRKVLHDMLDGFGHQVTEAVNGADCLEKATEQKFDLIFMDISMPVMDGVEATRRLRAGASFNADTHIIGLTAHGHEEYREKGEEVGMNQFHTKPIRLTVLNALLKGDFETRVDHTDEISQLPQELKELCDMLGQQKVYDTVDTFFQDLSRFTEELGTAAPLPRETLAEAVHRQKGAAVMLAQHEIGLKLSNLEDAISDGRAVDLAIWASELAQIAEESRKHFAAAMQTWR
jgi:PAS domain S-box-containing protein